MSKAFAEAGSNSAFRRGVDPLATVGIYTSFKTIERVSERVGGKVAHDRHGPFARVDAAKEAPPNPPPVLVLEADGMRVRLTTDQADQTAETATDGLQASESGSEWRECKVGTVASCLPGEMDEAGEYHEPVTLTQTSVATMENIEPFSDMLMAEAERRGLHHAGEVVAVSDAGHGLPEMWARLFPFVVWILDFFHVVRRLAECAHEVALPGAAFEKYFHKWKTLLYEGKVDSLLRSLRANARRFADRPERPSDLPERTPGRILWTHVFYIEKYRDHMDYPEYRRSGWPIGSGHAESLAGQVGMRMKAANKRWTKEGAEAMANLIAERTSQDGRWEKRWPAPLPRPRALQPS